MVSPARTLLSNLSMSPSSSHASPPAIHVRSVLTKNKAKVLVTLSVAPHSLPHVCTHTLIPNQTIQGLLAGCVSFGCPGVTPRSSGIKPFSSNILNDLLQWKVKSGKILPCAGVSEASPEAPNPTRTFTSPGTCGWDQKTPSWAPFQLKKYIIYSTQITKGSFCLFFPSVACNTEIQPKKGCSGHQRWRPSVAKASRGELLFMWDSALQVAA